jgi:ABC-type dipeptide/oligopeptide/nickel transport system permease component
VRGADYLFKRTAFAVVTIFVAITLNFVLFRALPGDAISNIARVPHANPQLKLALQQEFGLDKSKWQQYLLYMKELVHGNMGISFDDQQPVSTKLAQDLKNTIPMVSLGTAFSIVIGIATGVLSAWRRGTLLDQVSTNTAIAFYSLPTQVLGMMLLIFLAGTFPSQGMSDPYLTLLGPVGWWVHFKDLMRHMFLPALTLGLTLYGEYTLVVRSAMLETLGEDYILTARAKGLPARTIVRRHALRNAMLPIVTLIAISLGYIVAGTVLIEYVFSWPGIGKAVVDAVHERDYPMLQGAFLVLTLSVVFFNLAADLLYAKLDPRIGE